MRISFGIIAALIIFLGFFLVYSLISPVWDSWYEMALSANSPKLLNPANFLNFAWQLLPLACLIFTLLWLVVAGMGEAANPGKLLLGIIVLITGLLAMMLLYITCDPIISDWASLAGNYAGMFAPIISIVSTVWYNYCIPMVFALIIWVTSLAISTEAETVFT